MTKSVEIDCDGLLSVCERVVQCVGAAYFQAFRQRNEAAEASVERSDSDEKLDCDQTEVDIDYLRSLDPKEWKDQDHYKVLGLEKQRFAARDEDIKRAYRRMVLKHHPDKRKAKGEEIDSESDYFTCITRAYEILGEPKARRAYDSIDPEFDDNLPTQKEIDTQYYDIFNHYFDLNARWSEGDEKVPRFGDDNATRKEIEDFYDFWYDFRSWREFSYLDEEDKDKGQDRDERRMIEKENKVMRTKRKKEETTRIRKLVDLAFKNDKRVTRLQQEDKERKAAARRAQMGAAQAAKAEADRLVREAQLAKEREEKAEQKRIEKVRLEKEQQRKALKKERKTLRDKAKEAKYYGRNDAETIKNMEGVEKICETYSYAELQTLNKDMTKQGKNAFFAALKAAESRIAAELAALSQPQQQQQQQQTPAKTPTAAAVKEIKKEEMWSNDNTQLLIKAVNLFPAGTTQRWDVISVYINQHATNGVSVTARDVLNKAKSLQHSDFSKSSLKTQANEAAFESFEKSKKEVQTTQDITVNVEAQQNGDIAADDKRSNARATKPETAAAADKETKSKPESAAANNKECNKENGGGQQAAAAAVAAASKPWSKEEQALLEQAIKTFPNSTPNRWERIAECIPNRSKKECLRRVKEIVELVNTKKEAQRAAK